MGNLLMKIVLHNNIIYRCQLILLVSPPMKTILTLLLIFLSVTSSLTAIPSAVSNFPENRNAWFPEGYLITDVPYVAQTERNFCVYSCCTMVFNFMGLNTTLDEMLFYGGLGYTHSYNE